MGSLRRGGVLAAVLGLLLAPTAGTGPGAGCGPPPRIGLVARGGVDPAVTVGFDPLRFYR